MTPENMLVLGILAVAVVLFVSERLRVDLIAMLVLITLTLTGLVTIEDAFSGFASPAVITVWSVYIVSGALFRTGVADILANFMLRMAGHHYLRLLFTIMLTIECRFWQANFPYTSKRKRARLGFRWQC